MHRCINNFRKIVGFWSFRSLETAPISTLMTHTRTKYTLSWHVLVTMCGICSIPLSHLSLQSQNKSPRCSPPRSFRQPQGDHCTNAKAHASPNPCSLSTTDLPLEYASRTSLVDARLRAHPEHATPDSHSKKIPYSHHELILSILDSAFLFHNSFSPNSMLNTVADLPLTLS